MTKPAKNPSIGGRPRKFTPQVLAQCHEYLAGGYKELGVVPSLATLSLYLNVAKDTRDTWVRDFPEFRSIVDDVKDLQHAILLHGGLTGALNPTITKLILAKHGYHERVENHVTVNADSLNAPVVFKGVNKQSPLTIDNDTGRALPADDDSADDDSAMFHVEHSADDDSTDDDSEPDPADDASPFTRPTFNVTDVDLSNASIDDVRALTRMYKARETLRLEGRAIRKEKRNDKAFKRYTNKHDKDVVASVDTEQVLRLRRVRMKAAKRLNEAKEVDVDVNVRDSEQGGV